MQSGNELSSSVDQMYIPNIRYKQNNKSGGRFYTDSGKWI